MDMEKPRTTAIIELTAELTEKDRGSALKESRSSCICWQMLTFHSARKEMTAVGLQNGDHFIVCIWTVYRMITPRFFPHHHPEDLH